MFSTILDVVVVPVETLIIAMNLVYVYGIDGDKDILPEDQIFNLLITG